MGGRNIMFCDSCNRGYDNEALALHLLKENDILDNDNGQLYVNSDHAFSSANIRKKKLEMYQADNVLCSIEEHSRSCGQVTIILSSLFYLRGRWLVEVAARMLVAKQRGGLPS